MGEVIQGNFGREAKNRRDLPTPQDGVAEVRSISGETLRAEDLGQPHAIEVAERIKEHLKDRFTAQALIDDQYSGVKELPIDEVVEMLNTSTPDDWEMRSGFYIALATCILEHSEVSAEAINDSELNVTRAGGIRLFPEGLGGNLRTLTIAHDITRALDGQPKGGHNWNRMQELVSGYTPEEVDSWLEGHSEADWVAKPAFFYTLAQSRINRI